MKSKTNSYFIISLSCCLLIALLCSTMACRKRSICGTVGGGPFVIKGVDMSALPLINSKNMLFYNLENQLEAPLITLKKAGINTIRIRIWNQPASSFSNYAAMKKFAHDIKQSGFKLWVDLHYSDTWADPGHQQKPKAWALLSFSALKDSVTEFTTKVMKDFEPDFIQIGNEINNGLLWPEGSTADMRQFKELLQVGCEAAKNISPKTVVILHYAGIDGAEAFFKSVATVKFDMYGISYYPIWHGKDLALLKNLITTLRTSQDFSKPVVIAETAYPFTFGWNDYTNNILGDSTQILNQFKATADGQRAFISELKSILTEQVGICYWGGELVAYDGPISKAGSSWENQALWDFNNKELPALRALGK